MTDFELYGTKGCPYTQEMREWLEWKGSPYKEYDIEDDREALQRIRAFAVPPFNVPILVQDGKIVQIGWQGRSCVVNAK